MMGVCWDLGCQFDVHSSGWASQAGNRWPRGNQVNKIKLIRLTLNWHRLYTQSSKWLYHKLQGFTAIGWSLLSNDAILMQYDDMGWNIPTYYYIQIGYRFFWGFISLSCQWHWLVSIKMLLIDWRVTLYLKITTSTDQEHWSPDNVLYKFQYASLSR